MSRTALRKGTLARIFAFFAILLASYGGWVAIWAHQGSALRPVALGRDSCGHCGMLVADIHHAVSALDRDEGGNVVTRQFDDVGCFLSFARQRPGRAWSGVAHDFESGEEIPLDRARFERRRIETPMGTGWVASKASGLPLEEAMSKVNGAARAASAAGARR